MPELVVAYLDGTEERYPLAGQDIFIGRDTQLLVSIPDSKISRRHARMFMRRGAWFIEDLGSVNGVLIDGVRISTAVACALGQEMHIGDAVLKLVPSDAQPAAAARPSTAAAVALPGWSLRVSEGALKGLNLKLQGPHAQVLGRDAQADLIVADSSISRRHARLTPDTGQVGVEDLGSSNGTFVNDERVQRGTMRPGDRLRLGNVTAVLHAAAPARGGPASASIRDDAKRPPAAKGKHIIPKGARLKVPKGLLRRAILITTLLVALVALGVVVSRTVRSDGPATGVKTTPKQGARKNPQAAHKQAPGPETAAEADGAAVLAAAPAAPSEPEAQSSATAAISDDAATPAPPPNKAAQGRLARAWMQLVGKGPSSLERARTRSLAALYNKALAQSRTAEREAALTTVEELLRQDALHEGGRALQGQLLMRSGETEALRRAQSAMQAGQALEALSIVSQALDHPYDPGATERGAAKPATQEAQELVALGDQAALQLGQACGERAQAACMAQAWAPCIVQLACVLGYQPQATQARALLTLATDAVRGKVATSAPEAEAAPQTPLGQAQATALKLSTRYPQAALRHAVLVYSTGDIAAASQRLRPLTCPQCRVVGGDVRRVALGLPRAKQLRESGQHEAAHALYTAILQADERLCPPPTASVLHDLAVEGKQAVYVLQGTAAFERGAYKEALAAYLEGRALGPKNDGLEGGIGRLAHRAQDMLGAIHGSMGKSANQKLLPAAVCTHLHEVHEMTDDSHPAHQQAAEMLQRCGQPHEAR